LNKTIKSNKPENKGNMNNQQETKSISDFINAFSEALGRSDNKIGSTFYTEDGLFLPNNYPTISKDQLDKAKGTFLKNKKFNITYVIDEIVVKENFAFVQAEATATTTELNDDLSFTVVSRDLFILNKIDNAWKIYRYMFNDFTTEQAASWKKVS
jgi:ketosteroid isomerase-like protein